MKESSTNYVWQLTLLFIGLKLTGYIAWSWAWVLSPLWIQFIVALTVGIVVGAMKAYTQARLKQEKGRGN